MQDREPEDFRETEGLKQIWHYFAQDKIALFSFYLFIAFILTALFSQWIAPYPSDMQFISKELIPPSWTNEGQISFFFGTDDIGRDVFSRIIIGSSYTIGASLVVLFFTVVIGSVLGLWAGVSRSVKSKILSHFLDTFLSIPSLLIAIIIATLMQPSLINAILATTLALVPYFIHEIYKITQQELKKEYVLMLKLDSISNWMLLKETIFPNISVRYIQEIARAFAIAILDISSLSFISLGAQRPTPEWGAMIKDSLELIYLAPWTVILPGIAIIITILVVLISSKGLCKAIEKHYE
ncbi:ABC transporter permease subunit [Pasteurella dagmatis]|uniref:ABC transporter, permease protein n=1 Tax=Pasteurella dagmatis ATCC 43325 TaxID=667128 RepID=C9PQG7_9PAST|nr:ABC transporter permease subunit [Pasteurella dagmatis]EEX50089.1 ABC transporter, permease protein [Pasteurella dagmatis ATCC 43325]SNV57229.1 peptide transport system permease SapC [Pasteurella dagmatis]